MDDKVLNLVLRIKDEATDALKNMSGQVENAQSKIDGMGKSFMVAGGLMTAGGLAGVAVMKSWVDAAAEAQTQMTIAQSGLKNVAEGMKYTTVYVGENKASIKEHSAELKNNIQSLSLQASSLALSGKGHEDAIKSIKQNIISLKQHGLETSNSAAASGYYTTVLNKNALTYDQLNEAILKVSKSTIALGFDDESSYAAMVKNIGKTKDLELAKKMLNAEMEMARAKHMDLADAAQLLGRAYDNGGAALSRQGIAVDKNVKGMDLIDAVYKKFKGTVQETNKNYEQMATNFTMQTQELKEKLGERLLPVLTDFAAKILKILDGINNLNPKVLDMVVKITAAATAFGLIGGPILFIIGAFKTWGTIIATFTATLGAPILIIAALAAVVGLLYLAWTKNFGGIQQITAQFWKDLQPILVEAQKWLATNIPLAIKEIETIIMRVFTWIKVNVFPILELVFMALAKFWTEIQPKLIAVWNIIYQTVQEKIMAIWTVISVVIAIIKDIWTKYHNEIMAIATVIWELIKLNIEQVWNVISTIIKIGLDILSGNWKAVWTDISDFFKTGWDNMANAVKTIWGTIKGYVASGVNGVIDMINAMVDAINSIQIHIPGIAGSKVGKIDWGGMNLAKVAHVSFDTGGWVNGSGMAMVHDGEFVLSRDMMAGKSPVDSKVFNNNNSKKIEITAIINNPADWDQMLNKLSWKLNYSY